MVINAGTVLIGVWRYICFWNFKNYTQSDFYSFNRTILHLLILKWLNSIRSDAEVFGKVQYNVQFFFHKIVLIGTVVPPGFGTYFERILVGEPFVMVGKSNFSFYTFP